METATIGTLIKKHRQSRGISQSELAKACGLSDRHLIRKYEKDIVMPKRATMEILCEVLGVELSLVAKNNFAETLDI